MRIRTRRIRVGEMTRNEHETFLRLIREAAEGRIVNYSEAQLDDGSFLGVSVQSQDDYMRGATPREFPRS